MYDRVEGRVIHRGLSNIPGLACRPQQGLGGVLTFLNLSIRSWLNCRTPSGVAGLRVSQPASGVPPGDLGGGEMRPPQEDSDMVYLATVDLSLLRQPDPCS